MTCPNFSDRLSDIAIAPLGPGIQPGFEGQSLGGQGLDGQDLDGRAPPFQPCEVTFAEEGPWMFMGADDDESEVVEASQALIELQWSKWRQAMAELKPFKAPLPGEDGCALTAQSV